MAKRTPYSGKRVESGPLAGHFRRGRRYAPPMAALPGSKANDWVRDDLPDLLWPLILVASREEAGAKVFQRFQEISLSTFGSHEVDNKRLVLDGRLTSLERIPSALRAKLVDAIRDSQGELIPSTLLGVMRLYTSLPGAWLLLEPWRNLEVPSEEESLNFLASSIVDVVSNRHLNALTKTAPFGWGLMTGRIQLPSNATDFIEAVVDYPTIPENVASADAYILSAFLSFKAIEEYGDGSIKSERLDWARQFWMQNRRFSPCIYEHEKRDEETDENEDARGGSGVEGSKSKGGAPASMSLVTSYLEELDVIFAEVEDSFFDPSNDLDLHNPARSEVLVGLVTRAIRSTASIIMAPHMWTGEHGANLMRALLETVVVMKWLISRGSDEIFDQYQSYGWGKRKLQTKQAKDLALALEGDESDFLNELVEALERKGPGEIADQFQEVNLQATFSGITLRAMAEEVGELEIQPSLSNRKRCRTWGVVGIRRLRTRTLPESFTPFSLDTGTELGKASD